MLILLSGAPERVQPLRTALERAGAAVAEVGDGPAAGLPPADGYVQLPVRVPASGDTVVARVEGLLRDGLLSRFRTAAAVLPALAQGARVVLVGGHTVTGPPIPDDRGARLALMRVLGHAISADGAARSVRVRLLPAGTDLSAVVAAVLEEGPAGALAADEVTADADAGLPAEGSVRYEDWRTEVLGLLGAEI